MIKTTALFCFMAVLLSGCDGESGHTTSSVSIGHGSDLVATSSSETPLPMDDDLQRPLDLSVSQTMMNELMEQNGDTGTNESVPASPGLDLNSNKSESRIRVKGEVLLQDNWQDDYREAIDGGRIDVQLKFEE